MRFNSATHTYTCTTSGPYFFGVSAGIPAGVRALVQLRYMGFPVGELARLTSTTNDNTTLAGKFLMNCNRGMTVTVELITGQVSPGPLDGDSLLSFTAFHYNQTFGHTTAWSVYSESNWTANANGIDPFRYDADDLTIGDVSWSRSSNEVTISRAGSYYVYVSGGTQPNNPFGLTVQRNGDPVFGVYRTATNWDGIDTLGHGAVVLLDRNDRLKVVAEPNTEGYSAPEKRHTSFFGFLVISNV